MQTEEDKVKSILSGLRRTKDSCFTIEIQLHHNHPLRRQLYKARIEIEAVRSAVVSRKYTLTKEDIKDVTKG
jgi:hypothetical protein